jgi:arabinofuranan 3-O-arabinosyltransferase
MQRAVDPLWCVAIAAALAGALWTAIVCLQPGQLTMDWTNKDFANYWVASRLAFDGRVLEVFAPHETYFAHMQAFFGADYPWHSWSYPPHYLLLMQPLGLLPYKVAYIVFLFGTALLLCGAVHIAGRRPGWWQLVLLLPAVLTNAIAAQNGFLLGAFMLAGLALRDKQPVIAGICLGLLTVKPQLGVLLPFLLLYERQWRVIITACLTTAALVVVSALSYGVEAWAGYIAHVVPYQTVIMRQFEGLFLYMMPTIFGSVRSLGGDAALAFAIHIPFALAVLALYGFSLPRLTRAPARATSTVFATPLVVPYLLNYDIVVLAVAAVLWVDHSRFSPKQRIGLIVLVSVPMLMPVLGVFGWPVAPLVILLAWLALLHQEGALPRLTRRPTPSTP